MQDSAGFRPRVGLLLVGFDLMLDLTPGIRERVENYATAFREAAHGWAEVIYPGIVDTQEKAREAGHLFIERDVDAVVLIHAVYTPSGFYMPALQQQTAPILVWNTQFIHTIDDTILDREGVWDWLTVNLGVSSINDGSSVMTRLGIRFWTITSAVDDARGLTELRRHVRAAAATKALRRSRIGLVGRTFPNMLDMNVDETGTRNAVGAEIVYLAVDDFATAVREVAENEIDEYLRAAEQLAVVDPELSPAQLRHSARVACGAGNLAASRGLVGLALGCVEPPDILRHPDIGIMPALPDMRPAFQHLKGTVEGDVRGVMGMGLLESLAGNSTVSEIWAMDFKRNQVLAAHDGPSDIRMMAPETRARMRPHHWFEGPRGRGAVLLYAVRPGPITMLSLGVGPLGTYHMVVSMGEVVEAPVLDMGMPNYRVELGLPLPEFFARWSEAGAYHHLCLATGDFSEELILTADILGLDITCV